MVAKKTQAVATVADDAAMAALKNEYPTEATFNRILLPRLSLVSQDKTEEVRNAVTKKKEIKVIREAGTFFTETPTEELDEDGKKKWENEDLGENAEGIIIFQRKQLRFYDGEKYTSSPIYDRDDEVLPLFRDKEEVDRGTVKELQSRDIYQGKTAKGKPTTKLEANRILYVMRDGVIYQMSIRGTSMYAFQTYARKVTPNTVLTKFGSEPKENGSTKWSQMTFENLRLINKEEAKAALDAIKSLKDFITAEKGYYAGRVGEGESLPRLEGESDEDFAARKAESDNF